jgi:hypothetical protein
MSKMKGTFRRKLIKRLVKAAKRLYLADIAKKPVWESEFLALVDEVVEAAIALDNARLMGEPNPGEW